MQTTRRYRTLGIGVLAVGLFGATVLFAEEAAKATATGAPHVMLTGGDLKWVDGPPTLPAGAKAAGMEGNAKEPGLFTLRLKFPANYKISPHWHPADEHVTVISGTFYMGMGDKFDETATKELPTGSFIVMPTKQAHFAMTKGETVVQLHGMGPWGITYVNPADDPRTKAAAKK
jgi:quercetin dioxygenase-like cupin family protein